MLHSHAPLCLLAAAGLCATSLAQRSADPRIDDQGRDMGNYPPPRHFDHLHMRLEIDIPDMGKPMFNGIETLTITPIGKERQILELDAGPLKIQSITIAGRAQHYALADGALSIDLSPPLPLGQ